MLISLKGLGAVPVHSTCLPKYTAGLFCCFFFSLGISCSSECVQEGIAEMSLDPVKKALLETSFFLNVLLFCPSPHQQHFSL